MRERGCCSTTTPAQPRRPCRPRHPYAVPRTLFQCVCTRRRNCIGQLSPSSEYAPAARQINPNALCPRLSHRFRRVRESRPRGLRITSYLRVHPDEERRGALLHRPLPGPRGSGRGVPEATPGSLDFGLGGAVTPRPRLGGIGREFGDVKPDNGTGCAVNQSGAW